MGKRSTKLLKSHNDKLLIPRTKIELPYKVKGIVQFTQKAHTLPEAFTIKERGLILKGEMATG